MRRSLSCSASMLPDTWFPDKVLIYTSERNDGHEKRDQVCRQLDGVPHRDCGKHTHLQGSDYRNTMIIILNIFFVCFLAEMRALALNLGPCSCAIWMPHDTLALRRPALRRESPQPVRIQCGATE